MKDHGGRKRHVKLTEEAAKGHVKDHGGRKRHVKLTEEGSS